MKKKYLLFSILLCLCTYVGISQAKTFKSFDGVNIVYNDEGSGEPIVLLHGFINSRKSWDNTQLKKDLLDKGYRVIVPDLRGNGDSGKPQENKAYKKDAEVKDLKLLLDHLNIQHYKAVGYSRGSIVLAKLLTKDKRIDKAVLGGMGIDFTNPKWDRRIMFAKAFDGQVNEITKGAVDYATSINADMRSLHLQQKYQPVTSKKEMSKITIDVMVICGDEDADNGNAKELSDAFTNGIVVRVPGDHNGTYKTEGFSEQVLKFLE
ncbi:alpha/beta fold hydrolase [uncultured Maribacter sp.]|uniref:alpha/beta fold hydrolase n=1 Tax=uncultured Maribacter sp. TaxID=431308 RepID=UPI0030EF3498|tara:strand:+ start:15610 stop:16398 length:789 start_codon:yes stop_codon:yes gene_type:complete